MFELIVQGNPTWYALPHRRRFGTPRKWGPNDTPFDVAPNPAEEELWPEESQHIVLHHDFVIRNALMMAMVAFVINIIITYAITKVVVRNDRQRRR